MQIQEIQGQFRFVETFMGLAAPGTDLVICDFDPTRYALGVALQCADLVRLHTATGSNSGEGNGFGLDNDTWIWMDLPKFGPAPMQSWVITSPGTHDVAITVWEIKQLPIR